MIITVVKTKSKKARCRREKGIKAPVNLFFFSVIKYISKIFTRHVFGFCTLDSFHSSFYSWINLLKVICVIAIT